MKRWNIQTLCFLAVLMVLAFTFCGGCSRGGGESASSPAAQGQAVELVPPPLPPSPEATGNQKYNPDLLNGTPVSRELPAGWTALSFPFDSLYLVGGLKYYLYYWDGLAYQAFDPRDTSTLNLTKGCYAYVPSGGTTLQVGGIYNGSIKSIPLVLGWNFIAFPRQGSRAFSDLKLTCGGVTKTLAEGSSLDSSGWVYGKIFTYQNGTWIELLCGTGTNLLEEWKGYWVYCWVSGVTLNLVTSPSVISVRPSTGPADGGTPVTITGSSFNAEASVYFGETPASNVSVVNSSTINCTTPPHAMGAVDVTVMNPNMETGTLASGFTYTSGIRFWRWSNPYPTGSTLRSVWGYSPSDIYAVGGNGPLSGTLIHYNGTAWSPVNTGNYTTLYGVWGTSPSDVYAVGDNTILHYNGLIWSPISMDCLFSAIWGTGPSDIFAAGNGGKIFHYNGLSWILQTTGIIDWLYAVWGTGPGDVFAAGENGRILHYDGSSWTDQSPDTGGIFFGLWGSAGNNVLAVGSSGAVFRYNGTSWYPETVSTSNTLNEIFGIGPNDIYAVGDSGTVIYWDGSGWTNLTDITTASLTGICGFGTYPDARYTMVGSAGTILYGYQTSWTPQNNNVSANGLYGIWGSSSSDVFSVSQYGGILHFNGTSWSTMTSPTVNNLVGVWGSGPSDVFAVGGIGTICHYDGSSWSAMTSPTGNNLLGVWGSGPSDVFAVGGIGTICHYDGSSWSTMTSPTANTFWNVWGSGPSDVFAVGLGGTICHYDGTSWSAMTSPTANNLFGVWGSGPSDVFAVGVGGTICRYDGSSWSTMASPTGVYLYGVWGTSSNDVYVEGDEGTIFHYDGSTWAAMPTPTTNNLYGIWGNSTDVFVTGGNGTIIRY